MASIADSLRELVEARIKAQEELAAKATAILKPSLEQFMHDHPDVRALRWCQYTPYFNDGDECVFRVSDIEAAPAKANHTEPPEDTAEDDDNEDDSDFVECYGECKMGFNVKTWSDLVELRQTLGRSSEEELRAVFGDHVRVIVTRTGVETEEFDHD